ncbi:acyltransferase family protein [Sphingobacterium corticis]|uniref:Acyltransferase family protein n=1 Tax=Sphingobacterium corticis TaxID=1812823 RepID=A0ABW5NNJ7_9SPHI
MINTNTFYLTKNYHFKALDGLRGIAAIGVLLFHFMEIVAPKYEDSFIPHSYLAVDFFFCLSGFVIAHAYDDKFAEIGTWTFIKRRLVRLQPLVFIGAVIGLLAFVFDPFSDLIKRFETYQIVLLFLSGSFLIPYPIVPERYNNLFHLNPPTWSLFWEYIANVVYALVLVRATKRVLWPLFIIAAGLLCWQSYKSGFLAEGFGGDNFWAGGIRLFFSFTAGLLAYRSKWIIPNKLPFWFLSIALAWVFFMPFSETISPVFDPAIVIVYFPILLAFSAGADQSSYGKAETTTIKWLGKISYPLYMVHYPFIWLFYSYVQRNAPNMEEMAWIVSVGMVLTTVLAHLVLRYLNEPIRKYLGRYR